MQIGVPTRRCVCTCACMRMHLCVVIYVYFFIIIYYILFSLFIFYFFYVYNFTYCYLTMVNKELIYVFFSAYFLCLFCVLMCARQAFSKLDASKLGVISLSEMRKFYNVHKHPKVRSGESQILVCAQ